MCHDCSTKAKAKETTTAQENGAEKAPKSGKAKASSKEESPENSQTPDNNVLIMIDTTKTANQKRKEAAAARRIEKAQLKTNAKTSASLNKAVNGKHDTLDGSSLIQENGKQEGSMASDSMANKV